MLSAKSQSLINATFRSAKATYIESNYTSLISCLSEDKAQSGLGNSKQSTKEKALRFFDCLEELIERHRFVKVVEEDIDTREKLADDVVQLVIPVFTSFLNKHREKEFSKSKCLVKSEDTHTDILTLRPEDPTKCTLPLWPEAM
jgi:exocyst complex protein 7